MNDNSQITIPESNYPNITLVIRGNIPSLELENKVGEKKTIAISALSIDEVLERVAKALRLDESIDDIWEMLREGDETYIEFSEIDELEEVEIDLQGTLDEALKHLELDIQEEVNKDVSEALTHYHQADVLASTLEEIYNLLIARTVFTASEMGIGNIILKDERKEPRLREKMSKELSAVEIELIVA